MANRMKCIVNGAFETIFEALNKAFGNVYSEKFNSTDQNPRAIILGEEYFFRMRSDTAILIILEKQSSQTTKLEIISYAGGPWILGSVWSPHKTYIDDVKRFLQKSGLNVTITEET